jgi:hypothetical protein
MKEKTLEQLIKEALGKKSNKAFIKTSIAVFYGFTITSTDNDYIYGYPTDEIENKENKMFWRIPKPAIIEISFADYSSIKID